jgi:C-terminal processing protease CtpA/Prc
MLSALTVAATIVLATAPAPAPPVEIENVAAFARLYGVVRFFYPSDAAADLDWNRFAVRGVSRVRAARSPAELEGTLEQLVAPLGPGIEIGARLSSAPAPGGAGEPLVAWRYTGPGWSAMGGPYRAKRTHRSAPGPTDAFATLMQTVAAEALRGKAIRLRGQVRAAAADATGGAALWLRVDRANQVVAFFDNMGNRLVREREWRLYAIEGTVADDAEAVAFGVMAIGGVTAEFDAVDLAVKGATGDWMPVAIKDPGFEDSAAGDKTGPWFRTGPSKAAVSRPGDGAPQGGQYLRFAPPPAGAADVELFPEGAPTPGAHADFDLGTGLRARVPLALTDAQARPDPAGGARRAAHDARDGRWTRETPDIDQRLADVVVAWSVFRHFYPYWTEAGVDWESRLAPRLEQARAAHTRKAQLDALLGLVADARDGHGSVEDARERAERGWLPVGLAVVQGQVVVASSDAPAEAPVGAVVTTIDGAPARDRLVRAMALASGSRQWREVKALWALANGPRGAPARLGLDGAAGRREVALAYGAASPPPSRRSEALAELEPGVWYIDLTRAKMAEVAPKLEALAGARGVVFDLRGYPTDAGFGLLPHLLDSPETDRWMHVAKVVGPFHETAGWQDMGWDARPAKPRIDGNVVFLTDGRAISYAESVMGYVADRKLGTIVGGTTAGTNGNVASFATPGGFNLGFTGMRVTRHDGRSPHHLVGVKPDVPVAPTLDGVRAGRDEVLERGLTIARSGARSPSSPGPMR